MVSLRGPLCYKWEAIGKCHHLIVLRIRNDDG